MDAKEKVRCLVECHLKLAVSLRAHNKVNSVAAIEQLGPLLSQVVAFVDFVALLHQVTKLLYGEPLWVGEFGADFEVIKSVLSFSEAGPVYFLWRVQVDGYNGLIQRSPFNAFAFAKRRLRPGRFSNFRPLWPYQLEDLFAGPDLQLV